MTTNGHYGLGTFTTGENDTFAGLVVGESVLDLRRHLGDAVTSLALLGDWERSSETLSSLASDGDTSAHELTALRPAPRCGTVT